MPGYAVAKHFADKIEGKLGVRQSRLTFRESLIESKEELQLILSKVQKEKELVERLISEAPSQVIGIVANVSSHDDNNDDEDLQRLLSEKDADVRTLQELHDKYIKTLPMLKDTPFGGRDKKKKCEERRQSYDKRRRQLEKDYNDLYNKLIPPVFEGFEILSTDELQFIRESLEQKKQAIIRAHNSRDTHGIPRKFAPEEAAELESIDEKLKEIDFICRTSSTFLESLDSLKETLTKATSEWQKEQQVLLGQWEEAAVSDPPNHAMMENWETLGNEKATQAKERIALAQQKYEAANQGYNQRCSSLLGSSVVGEGKQEEDTAEEEGDTPSLNDDIKDGEEEDDICSCQAVGWDEDYRENTAGRRRKQATSKTVVMMHKPIQSPTRTTTTQPIKSGKGHEVNHHQQYPMFHNVRILSSDEMKVIHHVLGQKRTEAKLKAKASKFRSQELAELKSIAEDFREIESLCNSSTSVSTGFGLESLDTMKETLVTAKEEEQEAEQRLLANLEAAADAFDVEEISRLEAQRDTVMTQATERTKAATETYEAAQRSYKQRCADLGVAEDAADNAKMGGEVDGGDEPAIAVIPGTRNNGGIENPVAALPTKVAEVDRIQVTSVVVDHGVTGDEVSELDPPTQASIIDEKNPRCHAISLEQLLAFYEEVKEKYGDDSESSFREKTMRDVHRDIIEPTCRPVNMSYAQLKNKDNGLLTADVYVIHCWDEPFHQFVESISEGFRSFVPSKPNLWISAFALAPDKATLQEEMASNKGHEDDLEMCSFAMVLKVVPQVVLVRSNQIDLYSRIWCILEIVLREKYDKNHMTAALGRTLLFGNNSHSSNVNASSSCLNAEASENDDKSKILSYFLSRQKGGYQEVDEVIHKWRTYEEVDPFVLASIDETMSAVSEQMEKLSISRLMFRGSSIESKEELQLILSEVQKEKELVERIIFKAQSQVVGIVAKVNSHDDNNDDEASSSSKRMNDLQRLLSEKDADVRTLQELRDKYIKTLPMLTDKPTHGGRDLRRIREKRRLAYDQRRRQLEKDDKDLYTLPPVFEGFEITKFAPEEVAE